MTKPRTLIDWTTATWEVTAGCSRVSAGCENCYAERVTARIARMAAQGSPTARAAREAVRDFGGSPRWTNRVLPLEHNLDQPLRTRAPQRWFVNSRSDLFHDQVPDEMIPRVIGTAIAAHHLHGHILLFLTKRPERMKQLLRDDAFWDQANAFASMEVMDRVDPLDRRTDDARATLDHYGPDDPPCGLAFGVSIEDQATADERIPHLIATPADARFVSAEPLLGPIDLTDVDGRVPEYGTAKAHGKDYLSPHNRILRPKLDWVIAGGESGPGARPCHPDWIRSLRDQCTAAGVPFFFKQWGEWADMEAADIIADGPVSTKDGDVHDWMRRQATFADGSKRIVRGHSWTEHAINLMYRVGKKAAGWRLDGREHRAIPDFARLPGEAP